MIKVVHIVIGAFVFDEAFAISARSVCRESLFALLNRTTDTQVVYNTAAKCYTEVTLVHQGGYWYGLIGQMAKYWDSLVLGEVKNHPKSCCPIKTQYPILYVGFYTSTRWMSTLMLRKQKVKVYGVPKKKVNPKILEMTNFDFPKFLQGFTW